MNQNRRRKKERKEERESRRRERKKFSTSNIWIIHRHSVETGGETEMERTRTEDTDGQESTGRWEGWVETRDGWQVG